MLDEEIEAAIFAHTGFWPSTEIAATVKEEATRRATINLRDPTKNIAGRHIAGGIIMGSSLLSVLYPIFLA